jgi:hypothetical protein
MNFGSVCVSYNLSDSQVLNCATQVAGGLQLDIAALTIAILSTSHHTLHQQHKTAAVTNRGSVLRLMTANCSVCTRINVRLSLCGLTCV